jgi:hypothetical protein
MTPIQEQLSQLEKLTFTGKGEAFVESRFITPLLQCLGYETHLRTDDPGVRATAETLFDQNKDGELPLLNQAECAHLRVIRKTAVVAVYPQVRERITKALESSPEVVWV